MKKIIFIVLGIIIIVGVILTATLGLNVDIMYKAHEQINVNVGKEVNIKDIEVIAKDVFGSQRVKVTGIEAFNDACAINTENVTDEQLELLKQKVSEKYGIEDTTNTIEKLTIPKLRLRDLVKPYIIPIIVSTLIILVYMAIRLKKLGSIKVVIEGAMMLILAELFLLSIIAITRFPVNQYVVPVAVSVYFATIIALNIQKQKELELEKNIDKKEE